MRAVALKLAGICFAVAVAAPVPTAVWASEQGGESPAFSGPRCYKKTKVEAVYETSKELVRKARLVHEEADNGQITMTHFPAIYIEKKTLVSPEYVLLQEVACTKRILKKAEKLPTAECVQTKGCVELEPGGGS